MDFRAVAFLLMTLMTMTLFSSCGDDREEAKSFASLMPRQVSMAEAVTSLIANEIGVLSGPPTPGALVRESCVRTLCTYQRDGNVRVQKQALGCETVYGKLDGSSYLHVSKEAGLTGCITSWGPVGFETWPPSAGEARLAIGQSSLDGTVPQGAPANTLDRYENEGEFYRHWGSANIKFNGTSELELKFDHWTHAIEKATGNVTSHFHSFTPQPLKLRIEKFWDNQPRVYDGSFVLQDASTGMESDILLSNVTYRKTECCHPRLGTITITPRSQSGTSTFLIRFDREDCGSIELLDVFGRAKRLRLPACAS